MWLSRLAGLARTSVSSRQSLSPKKGVHHIRLVNVVYAVLERLGINLILSVLRLRFLVYRCLSQRTSLWFGSCMSFRTRVSSICDCFRAAHCYLRLYGFGDVIWTRKLAQRLQHV